MSSWLTNTFLDALDTIGFGPGSSPPQSTKRKRSEDGRGRTKVRRQTEATGSKARRQSVASHPRTPTKKRDSGIFYDESPEPDVRSSNFDDKSRRTSRGSTSSMRTVALESKRVHEATPSDEDSPDASPLAKYRRISTDSQDTIKKAAPPEAEVIVITSSDVSTSSDEDSPSASPPNIEPFLAKYRRNSARSQTTPFEPETIDTGTSSDASSTFVFPPGIQPATVQSRQGPTKQGPSASNPVSPKAKTVTLNPVISYEPDRKQGMSTQQKKATQADKRALQLALHSKNPKEAILREFEEPEYVVRDTEIRDGLWQLMDLIDEVDEKFFDYQTKFAGRMPSGFFKNMPVETVKIIDRVASGGPGGVQGWHDLFLDTDKRRALSKAIIGNVLNEQVFQHLFFGGEERHVQKLTMLQVEHRDKDSFDRIKIYSNYIRSLLCIPGSTFLSLPTNFANHANLLVGVLFTHLRPLLSLNRSLPNPLSIIPALHILVTRAGLLSLSMRLDSHTIYYFPPLAKDDKYLNRYMECINKAHMQQTHPRTPETSDVLDTVEQARRAKLSREEKTRAQNDDALVLVAVMGGVTAYRRGGWERADSTLAAPEYLKAAWAREGIRQRILTHGRVFCRWGRGRNVTSPVLHGRAWKGGFKKFTDVEGVGEWRAEKKAAKGSWKDKVEYPEVLEVTPDGAMRWLDSDEEEEYREELRARRRAEKRPATAVAEDVVLEDDLQDQLLSGLDG